jgi:hypothetical protein
MARSPPILPRVRSAQERALFFAARGKIGSPAPPLRGGQAAVLDPARSTPCAPPVFEQKEGTMFSIITLQDHMDELRAELRGCLNRRERIKVAAELEAAIAAFKAQDRDAEANRPPG